jgi:Ribonuclease G/E
MRDAMKPDRAKYDVTRSRSSALMEIARQRIKGEKMGALLRHLPCVRRGTA